MKYKIGDHVVIKESNVEGIEKFAGRTGVIKRVKDVSWSEYSYWITPDGWEDDCGIWCKVERLIESINPEKIIITTDGKTTTATKYFADGKKVSATANCSPEDTFDFNVGAKLAMERLMEAVEPPKYYNGKVVCISNHALTKLYTVGKLYEVVNGEFIDDVGYKHDGIISFEDWQRTSVAKWLEIKE